ARAQAPRPFYTIESATGRGNRSEGDSSEDLLYGGFRLVCPSLGVEIRGRNALLQNDRWILRELLGQHGGGEGEPPRRGIDPPDLRVQLSPEAMHERLQQFLRALGQAPPPLTEKARVAYEVPRFLYFEGDVLVFRQGVEVARCSRLWISPQDDRMVIEDAELRYRTVDHAGRAETFVVRGPRVVKQGPRWTGRDLQFTTCDAGEAHFGVLSGELE